MTAATKPSSRLAWLIMAGLGAGLVSGLGGRLVIGACPAWQNAAAWLTTEVLDPAGQVFLRLLFFVVVPLVFGTLTYGVVQLGRSHRLGPLAAKTFALFGLNMAVGVFLGLVLMNTIQPGRQLSPETKAHLVAQFAGDARAVQLQAARQPTLSFREFVEMFMPRNLLKAVVEFQILPLILFALLAGAAGAQLPAELRERLLAGLEVLNELMMRLVHFAMLLAPAAVAAMMASLVLKSGTEVLRALLLFVLCVLGGIVLHLFGTLSLLIKWLGRRSPLAFFKATRAILVTAFSTSSSNATLPTTIQVSRQELGISAGTAGFVLPLGATMNMSGTALYEGCVVLFIAQVYGIPMSLASQATLLLLTVLSAVAVAGIPGASLPMIVGLMASFGIPPEGIALILGVDRILDMARTTLNVIADVAIACIVDEPALPREGARP